VAEQLAVVDPGKEAGENFQQQEQSATRTIFSAFPRKKETSMSTDVMQALLEDEIFCRGLI
jgi:hypothetical protein